MTESVRFQPRACGCACAPGRSRLACSVRSPIGLSRGVSFWRLGDFGSLDMMRAPYGRSAAAVVGGVLAAFLLRWAGRIPTEERPRMTGAATLDLHLTVRSLDIACGGAVARSPCGRFGRQLDHG